MRTNNLKGTLILGVAALIWGMAFVAQTSVSESIPTFTINTISAFIATIALFLAWKFVFKKKDETFFPKENADKKEFYLGSVLCGVCLTVAINFQQFGISLYPKSAATEAHSGFITALYVILVPVFSVFLRKKIKPLVWMGGILAVCGIYLLCFSGGIDSFYIGDAVVFVCSIAFTIHILLVDRFVDIIGGLKLSIIQFFTVGVLSLILALIFDLKTLDFSAFKGAIFPLLYLGIMSRGIAYTLQIIGQKYAQAAVASITMSFESVFAALGGIIFSGSFPKINEVIGCVIMFAAIIAAQIPDIIESKKVN